MAELPPELENRVYEEFFAVAPAERSAALRRLVDEHPPHADALRSVWRSLSRGADATEVAPPEEAPPEIPGYQVGEVIGRGGFGIVYRAEQFAPLRRTVALKVLAAGSDAGGIQRRFEAERQLLARMSHPGIAQAFDAGATGDGRPWFAMEFVDGAPITQWLRERDCDVGSTVALCAEVCDAVQHAHQKGVIHRDLKPGNVLVTTIDSRPRPKVIDFGVAKAIAGESIREVDATQIGVLVGTPEYMSPEQAFGGEVDTRTDVYALGALLYHALTREPPFDSGSPRGSNWQLVLQRLGSEDPPLASSRVRKADPARARQLRGDLDWILRRAMAREPERRYLTVAELADDLRRHLEHRPVRARPPSLGYILSTGWRRHRIAISAATLVLLAVIVGGISSTVFWFDASRERERAESAAEAAQAALDELQALSTPLLAGELTRQANEDLWPLARRRLPDMQAWLERARARRPSVESARSTPPTAADFGAAAAGLAEALAGFDATIEAVEARARRAEELARSSLGDPAWAACTAAIAASPHYGGLTIEPQEGLVPLGLDPVSGLAEFAHLASGSPLAFDADRRPQFDADTGIVLVLIPGGPARFGSQPDDPNTPHFDRYSASNERPVRETDLAPFFVSKFEVTQAQWQRLAGNNPSRWQKRRIARAIPDNSCRPVEQVSWQKALTVLHRFGLDLPTEPQWETAARARAGGPWGEYTEPAMVQRASNLADASYGRSTVQGARFDPDHDDGAAVTDHVVHGAPNGYGLHGVFGNVSEWCRDAPYSYASAEWDKHGWPTGRDVTTKTTRVFRGGSYGEEAIAVRLARRSEAPTDARGPQIGLRPTRGLDR